MSKHPDDDYDAPPSYTESTAPNLVSSTITTTLSSLTSLLRTTQAQQSALESHATTALLPLLTPHLTSLLTRLGTTPHPPALAELVFVPAAAVGPEWSIASDADRRAGEVVQVIRVTTDESDAKGRGGGADGEATAGAEYHDAFGYDDDDVMGGESSTAREFDDWGRWDDETTMTSAARGGERRRRWWWWGDEGLARRLARQLQPEPKLDRTVVRAVVEQAKEEKKASRWGLFRPPPSEASSSSSSSPHSPAQSSKSGPRHDEDVSMTVRAEEVTFRKENEMGIWESTRGWAIVARVRIRR